MFAVVQAFFGLPILLRRLTRFKISVIITVTGIRSVPKAPLPGFITLILVQGVSNVAFLLVIHAGLLPKQVWNNAIAAARWFVPLHIL